MLKEEVAKALKVIQDGGIILYPTDTIWGIGCDATNTEAIEKIFTLKQRDEAKSMIVLLDNENKLESYVQEVPSIAYDLIEYAENPLTLAAILKLHIIPKRINNINIADNGAVTTIAGTNITFLLTGGFKVQGPSNPTSIPVITPNVVTTTGLLNIIGGIIK